MSDLPIIVLLHGMGSHEPGEITKSFVEAIDRTLNQIHGFKTKSIGRLTEIVEINYSDFLDEMREKMADNAKQIGERLSGISLLQGHSLGELSSKLNGFEQEFGSDDFFYTHWLDVVFYTTMLGAKIRVDIAKKLTTLVRDHMPDREIHLVAHSLGTAAIHDTLSQLYRGDFVANDDIPDLDPETHKLQSVWTIANVADLVNRVTNISDPYNSVVNPGDTGCALYLANVRHRFDPFTRPCRFDPQNDGNWIDSDDYEAGYQMIEIDAVTQYNTHDFGHYLSNPKVALPLLRIVLRIFPTPSERDVIFEKFRTTHLRGAASELKDAFEGIEVSDTGSLRTFLQVSKNFYGVVHGLEG
ncbi:hypothetical protein [Marinobacter alexandrii]|jgi:hypothetical protein|uniref:hypothetical protein n=1 Tax=Marinobacter alexandrii TaxID=2570351 RepID=UPI002ABE3A64|nr:hypothetical protein [Marinobacter alexandrii]